MGRAVSLRPIVNRPGAGRGKSIGRLNQARANGVQFDVSFDLAKLSRISDESIIAFILPERLAGAIQKQVAFARSKSFQRLHDFGNISLGREEEMYVVRHYDERVKLIFPAVAITNRFNNKSGYIRLAKVQRTCLPGVQHPVHRDEGYSGVFRQRKASSRRQAAVEAPGDEESLANGAVVRQMANVEVVHA